MAARSDLVKHLRALWAASLDLLYPALCFGCEMPVPDPQSPLCPRCLRQIERADLSEVQSLLARSPASTGLLDEVFCLWQYDKAGMLQHVHHALKYGNRPRYGLQLGRYMGRALRHAFTPFPDLDGIVPIPLHRKRLYERGYNQSTQLALGISQVVEAPVDESLLRRPYATRPQTSLSRSKRWHNVKDAFTTDAARDLGQQRLLLVDDVLTTGATALAAAAALKESGASSVHLAVLAMAA